MDKHQSNFLIFGILGTFVIAVFFVFHTGISGTANISTPPPIPNTVAAQLSSVGSPDGKMTLDMKQEKADAKLTYTFLIEDSSNGSQKEIYKEALPVGTTLSIPNNTFSPDDKYIFLKKTSQSETNYLVLMTSGGSFSNGIQIMDLSGAFASKYPDYKITDATGWGGVSLVVFNTDKADGSVGPSFWFEVPAGSIIQLSTRFN